MGHASLHIDQNSVTTAVLMRGGNVIVNDIHAINATASTAYLQLFDAAAAADVTLGTTVPTRVLSVAASSAGSDQGIPEDGLIFHLGVVVASTTSNTGAATASQHVRLGICG